MKVNWDSIKIISLALLIGILFAFSSQRNTKRNVIAKEVVFLNDENQYISYSTVNKLLIQNKEEGMSITKEILDLNEMEKRLDKNPMISKADVFLTVDGILGAKIQQRKPIARVAGTTSFYIDQEGMQMPLSDEYAARVPLITGKLNNNYATLKPLLLKIRDDQFLKNHIIGIEVKPDNSLLLQVRVYDFKIAFGQPKNIEKKIQNFKAFYQKTTKDNTIATYNLVNLELDNQVIGTKK